MADDLSATAALAQIQQGHLTARAVLEHYWEQIQQQETAVQSWTYLAIDQARQQVQNLDTTPVTGAAPPLRGIPVAVKDIFATTDMPTGWGMSMYSDRYLTSDATVVQRLRRAGAIILGKTVTTELATAAAGPTRNPRNLAHTPGGSSSGSAAAVAAGMVPLAIGSQTMGSVLRPATYCGIFGFKPSFGLIPRTGMMPVCRDLDHVGVFSRYLEDIHRLVQVLAGPDGHDPDCVAFPFAADVGTQGGMPSLALVRGPYWSQLEPEAAERLEVVAAALAQAGCTVQEVTLPDSFMPAWDYVQTLCACGLTANHGDLERYPDACSATLQGWFRRGRQADPLAYAQGRAIAGDYHRLLGQIFKTHAAILTPVTTGVAPAGLENTGSPIFCSLWTLCGLPALNLPVGVNAQGLPLGCQLVGAKGRDGELLAIAARLWAILQPLFAPSGQG